MSTTTSCLIYQLKTFVETQSHILDDLQSILLEYHPYFLHMARHLKEPDFYERNNAGVWVKGGGKRKGVQ